MKPKAEKTRPNQSKYKFKQVWGASLHKSCLNRYDLCVALSSTLKIYSWRGISMRKERELIALQWIEDMEYDELEKNRYERSYYIGQDYNFKI